MSLGCDDVMYTPVMSCTPLKMLYAKKAFVVLLVIYVLWFARVVDTLWSFLV